MKIPMILFVASIALASGRGFGSEASPEACRDALGWYPLARFDAAHGFELPSILRREGTPVTKRAWTAADEKEPGAILEHLELVYPSFTLVLERLVSTERWWIERFELRAEKAPVVCGIQVGASRDEVLSLLGKSESVGDSLRLDWSREWRERGILFGRHATIRLSFSESVVAAISWEFFAD